ncbi:MAG: hypothetical protein ABH871_07220 [Pseudomonadota bacterium]
MHIILKRVGVFVLVFVSGLILWNANGCSGDKTLEPTLEGNLLQYDEADLVNFNLSGDALCESCDVDIAGLYIELVSASNPTSNLSVGTFKDLGDFYFSNLRAVVGSTINVYGTLYFEDKPESQAAKAQTSFKVPDDDGKTVAVTLRFD